MSQEISISRFGDPLLSEQPFFVWGPLGCGKLYKLRNILAKKTNSKYHEKYHEILGFQFWVSGRICSDLEVFLENKNPIIIDGLDLCKSSIEKLLDKLVDKLEYSKSIFLVGDFSDEESIPNHIKANFRIVPHTEIEELN